MLITVFIFIGSSACLEVANESISRAVSVSLTYPQMSNAPKRDSKVIDKVAVVRGDTVVVASGIKPRQLNSGTCYLEFYLDSDLVYSTEAGTSTGNSTAVLDKFILDTTLYTDGDHTLVVNLWDKNGPSAIGVRRIYIQNEPRE